MGNGVKGGVESLPNTVRAYLRLHPDHIAIKTDIKNAFNSLHRAFVLASAQVYPALAPLIVLMYGAPSNISYNDFTFTVERGVNQGDPMGPVLYSTAIKPAVDSTLRQHPEVRITGIMDDKYLMGPAKEVLMAMETYARELAKMSLVLQPSKTAAIHGSALARGPVTGSAQDAARACKLHGIKLTAGYAVGGAPVGSSDYVHSELSALVERLTSHMGRVGDAIKHQTTVYAEAGAPAVRTSRLYKLLRWCLAPAMFSYHLRTAPVEETQLHAWRYDEEVFKIAMDLLGVPAGHDHINYDSPSGRLVRDRAHLHAEGGGLGLISASQTASDARLGNLLLTAHLVAQALGPTFDPAQHGAAAMPDLDALLAHPETRALRLPQLNGLSTKDAFSGPLPHMSTILSHARREPRLQAVLSQIQEPEAKAWLLSCGAEGANFLMADKGALCRVVPELANHHFQALARTRLGLQPTPYQAAPMWEFRGAAEPPPRRWGTRCTREGCDRATGVCGLHPLVCLEKGAGGAVGQRVHRHDNVKQALVRAMQRLAGSGAVPFTEPPLLTYWAEKPSYYARAPAAAAAAAAASAAAAAGAEVADDPVAVAAAAAAVLEAATAPTALAAAADAAPDREAEAAEAPPKSDMDEEEEAPTQPAPALPAPPASAPPDSQPAAAQEEAAGGRRDWVRNPRG
jgi:hypothetical protein